MWQTLEEPERNSIALRIDAQDPFNNYGAHAGTIASEDLSFYPGTQLLRVTNRQPAVGNRYFIRHGEELVPLHQLHDAQPDCDNRLGVLLNSGTAADYFRFAHFFSEEGRRRTLVEGPQDLNIDPTSIDPAKRQALAFIRPPEIKIDHGGLAVRACTFEEKTSWLCRNSYSLTPGRSPQLVGSEDSGIVLGNLFLNKQLKLNRIDI